MSEYIKCDNCQQLKMPVPLTRSGCLNCSYNSPWQDLMEQQSATIAALEERVRELDSKVDRLRGQLQNCVNHLDRAGRKHLSQSYSQCIESANKYLYETLRD